MTTTPIEIRIPIPAAIRIIICNHCCPKVAIIFPDSSVSFNCFYFKVSGDVYNGLKKLPAQFHAGHDFEWSAGGCSHGAIGVTEGVPVIFI